MFGVIIANTKVNGDKTKSMAKENTLGQMEKNILVQFAFLFLGDYVEDKKEG